ncbi:MAG: methyl-accepting chemotaxis protein [Deltaproteobacteria bacterium]|nr:MAG: methyl-accepting chemotaxis protein [Deltaproteobacteria bacterium]
MRQASVTVFVSVMTAEVLLGWLLITYLAGLQQSDVRKAAECLETLAQGDVHSAQEYRFGDPLLQDSLRGLSDNLANLMAIVSQSLEKVQQACRNLSELARGANASAGQIGHLMKKIAEGASLQTELVEQTSGLIQDMARSIQRASVSAEDAARSSREAASVAQSGSRIAGQAVEEMRGVFEGVERYAQRVVEFGEKTKEISAIVRVITDVAQQTHLLAINATIEAARAGDAGRGFAVVAEEIRQLAENTSRSADRINKIVEEITTGSTEAVEAVRASSQRLDQGRQHLSAIMDALNDIVASVTSGSDRVQIISRLAREQIAGAQQSVEAIQNISAVASRNAAATNDISNAVSEQSRLLLDVTRHVEQIEQQARLLQQRIAAKGDHQGDG